MILRILFALMLGLSVANAQSLIPLTGAGAWQSSPNAGGGGGYTGPGDLGISTVIAWWGLRCYSTSYTGNVADIWDAATGSTTETLLTCSAGGTINQTINALSVTCAVACNVKTLYDQSGANNCTTGCDLTQATNANRPAYVQSCLSGFACIQLTNANSPQLTTPNPSQIPLGQQNQPYTVSAVAERTATFTTDEKIFCANDGAFNLTFTNTTATIGGFAGSVWSIAASNSAFHAIQWVANGASSVAYLDGSSNAISAGTNAIVLNNPFTIGWQHAGSNYLSGNIQEVGVWFGTFSAGQQSSMNSNQHTYWGF
jgi:hypothetical protein